MSVAHRLWKTNRRVLIAASKEAQSLVAGAARLRNGQDTLLDDCDGISGANSTRKTPLTPQQLDGAVERLVADGPDNLHVVFDFDMTLTKHWVGGRRNMSSHGLVERYSKLSQIGHGNSYKQRVTELYEHYYPIEISTKLPREEKIPAMVRWWTEAHQLIVELGLTRKDLREMVRENPIPFREGIRELVAYLDEVNVPVVVFSAGIADLIEEILKQAKLYTEQMHIISNRIQFELAAAETSGDEERIADITGEERIVGFYEPILHVFNKNEFSAAMKWSRKATESPRKPNAEQVLDDPCHPPGTLGKHDGIPGSNPNAVRSHQELFRRPNVILVGDSVGDAHMADGIHHDVLLRFGLCNRIDIQQDGTLCMMDPNSTENPQEVLAEFLAAFDVVVCGDIGFEDWLTPFFQQIARK